MINSLIVYLTLYDPCVLHVSVQYGVCDFLQSTNKYNSKESLGFPKRNDS